MKVGIISPVNYLSLCTGDLHLCYANFLDSKVYLDFYRSREVMLDMSPALPRLLDTDLLSQGISLLKPSVVVLPSIDYSAERTISLHKSFIRNLHGKLPRLVGVLQGYDLDTLSKCYTEIKELCGLIALPSPLEKIARRDEIIRDLGMEEPTLYLEVYSDPYKEIPTGNTVGICTSFPIRLAVDLRELDEYSPTPPLLDFTLPKGDLDEELAVSNTKEYISIVKEGITV